MSLDLRCIKDNFSNDRDYSVFFLFPFLSFYFSGERKLLVQDNADTVIPRISQAKYQFPRASYTKVANSKENFKNPKKNCPIKTARAYIF